MFSTFALPCGWNGLGTNVLIPNWSQTSFNASFLNSVPLSLYMTTLPYLWVNMPDKYTCTTFSTDFSFMELQTCKTSGGKLLLKPTCYPWKVLISDYGMHASTAIGIFRTPKCCCGYLAMLV